jgi:benzoyl-CoA reductase subunit BamC
LTYAEREEVPVEKSQSEADQQIEMKVAFDALVKKHGLKKVVETFSRFSKR